jgi:hypothetical protein
MQGSELDEGLDIHFGNWGFIIWRGLTFELGQGVEGLAHVKRK